MFFETVSEHMDTIDSSAAVLEERVPLGIIKNFIWNFVGGGPNIFLVKWISKEPKASIDISTDSLAGSLKPLLELTLAAAVNHPAYKNGKLLLCCDITAVSEIPSCC
jgi:hypothetical protein